MTYEFKRSESAFAKLRALRPAPPGQTYVLVTLAFASFGQVLRGPEDLLAWVAEFIEAPQAYADAQSAELVANGSLSAEAAARLDGLLSGLAVVGPLPVELAFDPTTVVVTRLRLLREFTARNDGFASVEPDPGGVWN